MPDFSSLKTLLKKHASRVLPAGAVTAVLGASLIIGPAAIIGFGTGYNYGGSACTSANISAAPASPVAAGTASTVLTATSTTCGHPEYQFFLQSPGGSFTSVTGNYQPWNGTGTQTYTFATAALAPGVYGVGVWARNSGSTTIYEAYATSTFTITGNCNAAAIAASPASPSSPGTLVTFTASASGCPGAQFEFFGLAPGGSWAMLQAYSATATWPWTIAETNASPQGTYQIGVWARQAGSTNAYDAYAITTYVLAAGCGTAAITASPASPAASGTVTFTGTAAGCTGPLFEFWQMAPGGGWVSQGAFSASTTTTTINASSAAHGQYQVGVWVKDPKSAKLYDSYAIITYYIGT